MKTRPAIAHLVLVDDRRNQYFVLENYKRSHESCPSHLIGSLAIHLITATRSTSLRELLESLLSLSTGISSEERLEVQDN
jgi:hypothetical protein